MISIAIDGEAIKQISATCGESGVQHLLDTLRLFGEAEYEKAVATNMPKQKPKKLPSELSNIFAEQYSKHIKARSRIHLGAYRLAICCENFGKNLDQQWQKDLEQEEKLLFAHKPKELALIANFLASLPRFKSVAGLEHYRQLLFADYCKEDFTLPFFDTEQALAGHRAKLTAKRIQFKTHPDQPRIDFKFVKNLADLWARGNKGLNRRDFVPWLEMHRATNPSQIVKAEDLCALLRVKLIDLQKDDDLDTCLVHAVKWLNNGLMVWENNSKNQAIFHYGET